jgi:signal transduction histidine kinase
LDRETETHLYRITQEALNNIAKHAEANNVTVMLEKRSDDVVLIVEDDGIGFEAGEETDPNDATKGLGLLGMSERASLFGGNLEIESAPGNGTTIYVRVPFSG